MSSNTDFADPRAVLYSIDGAETVAPAWVMRWIDVASGADHRSAYAMTNKRRIVEWNGKSWCDFGPSPYLVPWTLADLNGDGTLDAVASDTCRMCTSNHVFFKGIAGTP